MAAECDLMVLATVGQGPAPLRVMVARAAAGSLFQELGLFQGLEGGSLLSAFLEFATLDEAKNLLRADGLPRAATVPRTW